MAGKRNAFNDVRSIYIKLLTLVYLFVSGMLNCVSIIYMEEQ